MVKRLLASAAGLNYSNDIFAFLQFSVLQKNVILLFDGLDEAGMWRPAVESYVMEMHRSQVNGIIVTSRLSRYDADETIRNPFFDFSLAKILPLSANMQIEIAHKRGVNDAKFTQLLKEEKYRELCQSPFLLSMMIEYFKRNKKTIAPVQADVFAKAMDTLIEKYITNKSFTMRTALPESESLFRFLIWLGKLLHENRLVEFSKEYIEERVKMSEELKAQWNFLVNDIEEGLFPILVMHRKDFYRFSHLSFQEFFVARAWANPEILSIIRK
jgi:predicted NACHT family NTPase